jgi:epoxyqueuosine reductase
MLESDFVSLTLDPRIALNTRSLTAALKKKAFELGFDLAEPAAIVEFDIARLDDWISKGYAGEMRYFAERMEAYRNPNLVLDGVKSVLMLGMNYRTVEPIEPQAGQGRVSRYAWGEDYHTLIRERLNSLADFFRELEPSARCRGIVDTAPFPEKIYAAKAGLGWIGKNTTLISPQFGSWIFLAGLLTTVELEPASGATEASPIVDRCGDCNRCVEACPTGALFAPYRLDARRCISYLTVEYRGDIPEELRRKMGNRLFGCDACQEACPWNHRTPATAETAFSPREGMNPVDLEAIDNLDEDSFRNRFRGSPIQRVKREGLLRNAGIAKENRE